MEASTPHPSPGMYCAHVTRGGAALVNAELRELLRVSSDSPPCAFAEGFRFIPQGDEALLALYSNFVVFYGSSAGLPRLNIDTSAKFSPMGEILLSHHVIGTPFVLRLIGTLQSCFNVSLPNAPRCRSIRSQLEIMWESDAFLYLVLPDFERSLEQVALWLERDQNSCLRCLSHALAVLFPFFDDLPRSKPQLRNDLRMDAIYHLLRSKPEFSEAAVRLYFLLHGTGWKTINESDVIDLPNFIGYGCATKQLGVMLQSLERIYQGSRYEPLVSEVCRRIKNPACIDARQACVEELLVHKDVPMSHAWKLYEMEQQLPFLLKIAPTVPDEALPMALSRVCALSRTLPALDSFDLLTAYLNRLLRQNGPYCASYKPKLIELLEPLLAGKFPASTSTFL